MFKVSGQHATEKDAVPAPHNSTLLECGAAHRPSRVLAVAVWGIGCYGLRLGQAQGFLHIEGNFLDNLDRYSTKFRLFVKSNALDET